jgi:hypothetical protein
MGPRREDMFSHNSAGCLLRLVAGSGAGAVTLTPEDVCVTSVTSVTSVLGGMRGMITTLRAARCAWCVAKGS